MQPPPQENYQRHGGPPSDNRTLHNTMPLHPMISPTTCSPRRRTAPPLVATTGWGASILHLELENLTPASAQLTIASPKAFIESCTTTLSATAQLPQNLTASLIALARVTVTSRSPAAKLSPTPSRARFQRNLPILLVSFQPTRPRSCSDPSLLLSFRYRRILRTVTIQRYKYPDQRKGTACSSWVEGSLAPGRR